MKVFFVRHGESVANQDRRYSGQSETSLTKKGRCQAHRAGRWLADRGIERLYCSDLNRSEETARIIGAHIKLEPKRSELLREVSFGAFEGMRYDEISDLWGDEYRRWIDDPYHNAPQGGERLSEALERILMWLDRIEEMNDESVCAVSHGGLIRCLLQHVAGCDSIWDASVDSGSINIVECTGGELKALLHDYR